jgi:hypothetical protein
VTTTVPEAYALSIQEILVCLILVKNAITLQNNVNQLQAHLVTMATGAMEMTHVIIVESVNIAEIHVLPTPLACKCT